MTRVPTGSFSYQKSSPYAISRGAERRLSVTTRSRRAPGSWRSSAVVSSLSLLSGRAIRGPSQPIQQPRAGSGVLPGRLGVVAETYNRPLAIVRGGEQAAVGIYRYRMPQCAKKWQVVIGIRVSPACGEIGSSGVGEFF